MELSFKPLFEPLNIEIGGRTIEAAIDLTTENMLNIAAICTDAKQKVKALELIKDKAVATNDIKAIAKVNRQAADALEPAIKAAIGDEAYEEVIEACGCGRKVSKADCNQVMTAILLAVNEAVADRQNSEIKKKAAHYLSEVGHAQPEPNEAE